MLLFQVTAVLLVGVIRAVVDFITNEVGRDAHFGIPTLELVTMTCTWLA